MKHKLREAYWWPGLSVQVDKCVAHCVGCQYSKKSTLPTKVPNISVPKPLESWTKIGIAIAGLFTDAPAHQQYIITIIDYATNFPECLLTTSITSATIIKWLETVFGCCENPSEIVSNNGPQFVPVEFEDFLKSHGISHMKSSVYNPTENGLVEVFNRSLKYGVQCFTQECLSWQQGITELLKHFRATPAKLGQKSPGEAFFGRRVRLDFEPVLQKKPARLAIHRILIHGPLNVGDLVLTKRPQAAKGHSPYMGLFRVVTILGCFTYLLSDGQKWNVCQLKRFLPSVTLPECDPGLGQLTQWSPNTQHSEAMEEWASHGHRPLLEPQGHEERDCRHR